MENITTESVAFIQRLYAFLPKTFRRPDNLDELVHSFMSFCLFWADFLPIEEESSSAPRVHRSHNKKDARRSPRAASTLSTASNTKTLPVRSTRARTLTGSYNQSDEEDISGLNLSLKRCCRANL